MRTMLLSGELDERMVELTLEQKASPIVFSGMGMEHMDVDLQGMLEKIMPRQSSTRQVTVAQARSILFEQECEALLEPDKIHAEAIDLAENLGIIFVDEIDKVVASESKGADVRGRGSSGTCCRSWKGPRSRHATVPSGPTMSCLLRPARFIAVAPAT